MDPDANLREQCDLARCIIEAQDDVNGLDRHLPEAYRRTTGRDLDDDVTRLAELVQALDQWLSNGGFPPAAWQKAQREA